MILGKKFRKILHSLLKRMVLGSIFIKKPSSFPMKASKVRFVSNN
tara:strand:+ start:415 stop:549 length:135 start_codon:yes stop_codon:yes gene_type:complete